MGLCVIDTVVVVVVVVVSLHDEVSNLDCSYAAAGSDDHY